MWPKNLKDKNGFTLVEIIVVLIILAILAAFTIPTYLGYVENSKVLMDESTVGLLNRTTQAYRISYHQNDPGTDPFNDKKETSEDLLKVLVDRDYLSDTDVAPKTKDAQFKWKPGVIGEGRWFLALANSSKGLDEYPNEEAAREAGFEVKDDGDSYTILDYSGEGPDVIIPSKIGDKPVTAIGTSKDAKGDGAFEGKGLTSVIVPDSVTYIGNRAFLDNSLTSVKLPDGLTRIDYAAFAGNRLNSITIPDSVTFIGTYAFRHNELTSLEILNSVSVIGDMAFEKNKLTEVTIPDSVTNIGTKAFSGNPQLMTVTILGKPERIVPNAFDHDGDIESSIPEKTQGVFKLINNKWELQSDEP